MFRLPNSLSILKKYKKQKPNQDGEGGETNRPLGAAGAVGGQTVGGPPMLGQIVADQQQQQAATNSSNVPGGGQQINFNTNNLAANPAAPAQGVQDNKLQTQIGDNNITGAGTGGNFDQHQ